MIFLIYSVFYLVSTLGIISVAYLAYRSNKITQNKYFTLFGAAISAWLLSQFLSQVIHENHDLAILFLRLAVSLAPFIGYVFLLFAQEYTNSKKLGTHYLIIPPILILFLSLLLGNSLVEKAKISQVGIAIEQVGFMYVFVILYTLIVFGWGLVLIVKDYSKSKLDRKRSARTRLLIISLLQLLVVTIAGSVFLAENLLSQILLPISAFIMVVIISYAVVRHQLFNVRLIIARALTYLLVIFAIAVMFSFIVFGILAHFVPAANGVSKVQQIPYLITALVIGFTLRPLLLFFNKISNSIFYRDAYNSQQMLDKLGTLFALEIDIEKITKQSLEVICTQMRLTHAQLIILSKNDTKRIETWGRPPHNSLKSEIFDNLKEKVNSIDNDKIPSAAKKELQSVDVEIVVSLITQDGPVGYLLLGPKKSGNFYTSQDTDALTIISNEMAVSIQNSLLFDEIKQFNLTLQEKVDDATKKLRNTNRRLQLLDETKDDFISMASHQLRTPLTSVKGYLSLVLDGDAGNISDSQRKLLTQAFFSSQRMVFLIADLLNVSRLKTGKFIIERTMVNLADIIEQELAQLVETAKGRDLTLEYKKPEHFPELNIDETKTRQVIMNFCDNAIYYTPAGGHIQVLLEDHDKSIDLKIVDDGIGVPKQDQHHLFGKFYRAKNAQKARPDGTGLGLFMAKKIIVAQGGAIIFNSQDSKGSTFGFTFPKAGITEPPKTYSQINTKETHVTKTTV